MSHWYDFATSRNETGSDTFRLKKAQEYADNEGIYGKQTWHEHRYGLKCTEGCRVLEPTSRNETGEK